MERRSLLGLSMLAWSLQHEFLRFNISRMAFPIWFLRLRPHQHVIPSLWLLAWERLDEERKAQGGGLYSLLIRVWLSVKMREGLVV